MALREILHDKEFLLKFNDKKLPIKTTNVYVQQIKNNEILTILNLHMIEKSNSYCTNVRPPCMQLKL